MKVISIKEYLITASDSYQIKRDDYCSRAFSLQFRTVMMRLRQTWFEQGIAHIKLFMYFPRGNICKQLIVRTYSIMFAFWIK